MAQTLTELDVMRYKLTVLTGIHQKEQFGDCVEDGERYPCQTVRVIRAALDPQALQMLLDDEVGL